jgi:Ca2+-binding EF-hand superfamily protein
MGCGASAGPRVAPQRRGFVEDESRPGCGSDAVRDFDRVGLTSDGINKFWAMFTKMDVANTGFIDLEQFYRHFHLDRSPFADRVFSVLDTDGSGSVDFREFTLALWNFCSMDHRSLMRFSFTLFDTHGTGQVETSDMYTLVKEVYGKTFESNPKVALVLKEATENDHGHISFDEFREINKRFPNLLFPAYTFQTQLRRAALGEAFWDDQARSRAAMGGAAGAYSIWDIIQAREMGKSAQNTVNLEELRAKRWKPAYHKEGDYVPETGGDSKAKAVIRRKEVYGNAPPAMPAGMADEPDDDDGGDDGGADDGYGGPTFEGGGDDGGGGARRGSVTGNERRGSVTAERRGSVGGRRQSINGAPVRRASISGGDTGAARRKSVSTGVVNDRRQSLVGASNTRFDTENVHTQGNRTRRRSSLANAQERAAAFAMMSS